MYFKRIEMHGFKSFAEPVVIEFNEGVTCIVGPNGSGKSNISDAIRWVLGEQSPKMLRGGKMEEVIFNGTASRKSRGMAEVTLVIDNSENILPIDYNEVAITRRMYRSGESEYLINNNICRLRDIKELIMDTGIGVDGYSIIGQGKIQSIVDGKPEDRREILEESAGVVMYKSKKAEAERKLSSANINLDRVNDIISEIEGRIDTLHEDSVKAKEALELRSRKRVLDINITLRNIEKFTEGNESGQTDVLELQKNIDELSVKKTELDSKIEKARERNENLEQLGNDARDKLLAKVNEINEITNKSQVSTEKIAGLDREINRLTEEIDDFQEKLERELKNAEEQEKTRAEIENARKNSDEILTEKIAKYNSIISKSFDFNEKLDEKKNLIMELTSKASGLRSEAKSIENLKDSLENRKQQILQDSKEVMENSKAALEQLKKAEEEKKIKEDNLVKIEAKHKLLISKKDSISDQIREKNRECEDTKVRLGQINSRKKTIEEMEANYEGFNGAVKFIMKSGISGLKGVVAELTSVPPKYETAIETALGNTLQNIICEKDNDAKKAIDLLKREKAGRLTFLPIESVYNNKITVDKSISSAHGYEGIACDLIKFDSKYDGIFEYLLGNVVVCDNMDTAIRLSKIDERNIKFVTLDGEIINARGAITGGKFKNASANLLSRRNEIIKLQDEIKSLENKEIEIEKDIINLEDDLNETVNEINTLSENISNNKLDFANLSARIIALSDSAKGAEDSAIKREKQLKDIEDEFSDADKLISKSIKEADDIDSEINSLEAEIEALEEENTKLSEDVKNANEDITQARISKTDNDNKYDAISHIIDLIQDNIDEYTEQIDLKSELRENIEAQKEKLLFTSDDSENNYEALSQEKKELDEYIAQVTKDKQALSDEISSMNRELNELVDNYNSFVDQKQQQEIKLAKTEAQLETAKERLWEDFEISYAEALEQRKEDFVYSTAVKESREIKNRLDELGDINVGAIEEYEQVSERYNFLTEQRSDITSAMDELNKIIQDMDKTIKVKFKSNFDQVVENFEEIFKELFGGGHAELRLDNEDNPLESGIEIIAQPPGKKLQNINLMSGGEKSMTAIALMFAVLKTKPTPFCILDEVEAALDDNNIDRFAKYLRNFNDIQFAVVTHQKTTMEHADVLYGVTMPEQGISKVISLKLGEDFEL